MGPEAAVNLRGLGRNLRWREGAKDRWEEESLVEGSRAAEDREMAVGEDISRAMVSENLTAIA